MQSKKQKVSPNDEMIREMAQTISKFAKYGSETVAQADTILDDTLSNETISRTLEFSSVTTDHVFEAVDRGSDAITAFALGMAIHGNINATEETVDINDVRKRLHRFVDMMLDTLVLGARLPIQHDDPRICPRCGSEDTEQIEADDLHTRQCNSCESLYHAQYPDKPKGSGTRKGTSKAKVATLHRRNGKPS